MLESGFDPGPRVLKILLSVLRKESGECADFEHAGGVPRRIELLDCPSVDVWVVVPRLRLVVIASVPDFFI